MSDFFYGVIEGFYGRQWSWQIRADYAAFLSAHGFDCYIYAPKGDAFLRARWRELYTPQDFQRLETMGQSYHRQGLRWGLGLSPLGLSSAFDKNDREQLLAKVEQINAANPDILCILFDDSRGDIDGLANRQLEIVETVLSVSCAAQHIVCPTYYSFDPVLERVFGKMPEGYLTELGSNLPQSVGIFWTGNQVISPAYSRHDIESVSGLLHRKPILWDNYPVNDGKLTSEHLHLQAYTGRPCQLASWSRGHLVNPMNQPHLSQLVLQSLACVYADGDKYSPQVAMDNGLAALGNVDLADRIKQDIELFQHKGLGVISEQQRLQLIEVYQHFSHPVAVEISDWLAGDYRFDPDCLTG